MERFIERAKALLEQKAKILEDFRRFDKAAEVRAQDPLPLARRLWAEEQAARPEVLAAFIEAHPGYEEHPEEPGLWVSKTPVNQADISAWDEADARARREAEASGLKDPGAEFVASDGSRWRRLDTSWGAGERDVPMPGSAWKCVDYGPRGPRPERDWGDVWLVDWVLENMVAQPEGQAETESATDSPATDSPAEGVMMESATDSSATDSPVNDSSATDSSVDGVTILNFGHPMTEGQMSQIRDMTRAEILDIIDVDSQVDLSAPLAEQVVKMVGAVPLSGEDWQAKPILVNLPGLSASAAILLSELSGRMGYLPSVIRMRMAGSTPPKFEVAEIINLQAIRSEARNRRSAP